MEKKYSYGKGTRCKQKFERQETGSHLKQEKFLHKHLFLSQMAKHRIHLFPMFFAHK